jgi:D-serine deaminase-like pyridoxal phosphate-dependent protein
MFETPCIRIDVEKMERNIETMAKLAERNGVQLRPHVKTHKIPKIAQKQIDAGAVGVTVAKVSEAEVMANGGITNIFIAYPLITNSKVERAIQLSQKIHLIIGVDSWAGALKLSEISTASNHTLNIRLEIDTGLRRTGVLYGDALALAQRIHTLPNLKLNGIYTYRGPLLDGQPTLDLVAAGLQEGQLMVDLAELMRQNGVPIHDVSVGSTPTAPYAAQVKGVTEIRPGTYVFQDRMQVKLGVCSLEDCAATVHTTIISLPEENRGIIDGGSKTFATDVQPNTYPLGLQGFGYIIEDPEAVLERMSEEHGMLRFENTLGWQIGDQLNIIPNHICSTINLHNKIYLCNGDHADELIVAGRGRLD